MELFRIFARMAKYMTDGRHTKFVGETMVEALSQNGWTVTTRPVNTKRIRPKRQVDAMNAAGKAAERAGYAIRSALVQSALDAETAMINLANAFRRLQP